jgi:hypothetical protein
LGASNKTKYISGDNSTLNAGARAKLRSSLTAPPVSHKPESCPRRSFADVAQLNYAANYAPWDEGEPLFSADAQTIVQDALAHYEERIDQLFADEPNG